MFQSSSLFAATAAVLLFAASTPADAAACRDAQGHFAACPAPAAKAAAGPRCRSANGAFTSCTAPAAVAASSPTNAPAMNAAAMKARAPGAAHAATNAGLNSAAVAPGAVSARCKDGTFSHSLHRSGSCSGHGGVAAWM